MPKAEYQYLFSKRLVENELRAIKMEGHAPCTFSRKILNSLAIHVPSIVYTYRCFFGKKFVIDWQMSFSYRQRLFSFNNAFSACVLHVRCEAATQNCKNVKNVWGVSRYSPRKWEQYKSLYGINSNSISDIHHLSIGGHPPIPYQRIKYQ